jgi:hypothetical protein
LYSKQINWRENYIKRVQESRYVLDVSAIQAEYLGLGTIFFTLLVFHLNGLDRCRIHAIKQINHLGTTECGEDESFPK